MLVADVMSRRLVAARMFETARNVADRMKHARIRHMPVVDEDGELIGIVSDRDVIRGLARDPEPQLRDMVTRHVSWVHPDTPAEDAVRRMLELKVGSLPVLEGNRLVGIVTETDFMMVAQRAIRWLQMANERAAVESLRKNDSDIPDHVP